MPDAPLPLLQGTLDVLVLKALGVGPRHGYGVAEWIRRTTEGVLEIEDGALYSALHRLDRRGLVESEWGVSENNRRAKYYRLTGRGRSELAAEQRTWARYADAVSKVLRAGEAG